MTSTETYMDVLILQAQDDVNGFTSLTRDRKSGVIAGAVRREWLRIVRISTGCTAVE